MPKIIDHDHMRAELLERCFEPFACHGFHGMTMRKLAGALGVSTGTLYHYFPNKSVLFAQMVPHLVRQDVAFVLSHLETAADPPARLRVLFDLVLAREGFYKRLVFLLLDHERQHAASSAGPHPDGDFFHRSLSMYRDAIEEHLKLARDAAGSIIISLVIGSIVQRAIEPSSMTLNDLYRIVESGALATEPLGSSPDRIQEEGGTCSTTQSTT